MSDSKLSAYEVIEIGEGHGCIVFATSSDTARLDGARQLDVDSDAIESCQREQWADKYAPGPVPKAQMLKHGWWFKCHHCGQHISEDDGDGAAVEVGKSIYCSQACADSTAVTERDDQTPSPRCPHTIDLFQAQETAVIHGLNN